MHPFARRPSGAIPEARLTHIESVQDQAQASSQRLAEALEADAFRDFAKSARESRFR